jgi:hypothetical protein
VENLARPVATHDFGNTLRSFIGAEGSATIIAPLQKFLEDSHDTPSLRASIKNTRPALIADIAHFMCISHGRLPGVIDYAATKILDNDARTWLVEAIEGFASERAFLNKLTVAAGPITRQIGQEKITALIAQQTKNFQLLASSDRNGTPAGAAIAFILDWQCTRQLLEVSAISLGMQPPKLSLPNAESCIALADIIANTDGKQRAMNFGAQQLLGQQRGLWQLISARYTELSHHQ